MRTATETTRRVEAGALSCAAAVAECLAAVDAREAVVQAFAHVDAAAARAAARALDADANGGGALRGVVIGVKDVIEVAGMPAEYNSPLYAGHRSSRDANCVAALRAAGAIVLGKTATVEFASLGRIPPTTNPHDPAHTPGGTSGGSAAAVATGMVHVALATQTGGSTIRPASFCGVAALKPSFGVVSTDGLRPYAPSLDTITWMARGVDDLALVARALRIDRAAPRDMVAPSFGVYRTPYWDLAGVDTRAALAAAADALRAAGATVAEVTGPPDADRLNEAQDVVMHGEGRAAYLAEYLASRDALAAALRDEVEDTRGIDAARLRWAQDYLAERRPRFDAAIGAFDAWLTPAVPGAAPRGLESTGEATFNRLWTGLHVPAVALPGFTGAHGLPVGVQLVAPRFADAALLAAARFAETAFARAAAADR
jgi:Asp-tRNA(Asn)/Glu-tRNA(Gln) amidotransferase A subunit family amidase